MNTHNVFTWRNKKNISHFWLKTLPCLGLVAQSDVQWTGDHVMGFIPTGSGNIHPWRLIMKYFLWSFYSFI